MNKNISFFKMIKSQLGRLLTSPEQKLKDLVSVGNNNDQLEEKYNKIKGKVDPDNIIRAYIDVVMGIRLNKNTFNLKNAQILLKDIPAHQITDALIETMKCPAPELWEHFFKDENLKSKIDFNNEKLLNIAVQFNAVEAVNYLVKEQSHILNDEKKARLILKKCINDKREEIVNILLNANINCDSFKPKNEIVIPDLLELPPIKSTILENIDNPVIKCIRSHLFNCELEDKLPLKAEPTQKRQKI